MRPTAHDRVPSGDASGKWTESSVGDYRYYVDRARRENGLLGLGAFLLMNEQLTPR